LTPTKNSLTEITATGIGQDANAAEKQALIAAVQQAVGSYLDSKTVTENELIIKDRILSLSNGFVSKYVVIAGPQRRDDGLFEVTIKAQVQGGQVVAKLKEENLIKGEVAGQNLYAQNLTQMLSAQDAIQLLQDKLPSLFVSCIKMDFVDSNGNPTPNSNPVEQERNDVQQAVKCTWYVRLSVDRKPYRDQMIPILKRCYDAILGVPSIKMKGDEKGEYSYVFPDLQSAFQHEKARLGAVDPMGAVMLIDSLHRGGCDGFCYYDPKYWMRVLNWQTCKGRILLEVLSNQGDVIASSHLPIKVDSLFGIGGDGFGGGFFGRCISPLIDSKSWPAGTFSGSTSISIPIQLQLPVDALKNAATVKITIDPPKPQFSIYPVGRGSQQNPYGR
jgi:hypothetical protein